MATETPAEPTAKSQHPSSPAQHDARKPLRLLVPTIAVAIFWAIYFTLVFGEWSGSVRFLARFSANAALLLFFMGWWLSRRQFRWRTRLGLAGLVVLAVVLATLLGPRLTSAIVVLMTGMPILFTMTLGWLALTRMRSGVVQATGFAASTALVFGVLTLLRWDGLDGRQRAIFNWRWTATAEEQFLAARADLATDAVPINEGKEWVLDAADWPTFRGGERESVVTGAKLADWSAHPPELVWRQRVGPGWSSFAVVDGFLVTQEQRADTEAVVCYEAASGKPVWAHQDPARFEEGLSGTGPRGTPTFSQGRIYSLGAQGKLNCLSASTGQVIWSKEILSENGAATPQWGLSGSPLVIDGLVVVFAGGTEGRGLLAYRAESGELAWKAAGGTQSYSSPQLMTIAGVRQIVMHDNRALFAVKPEDGTQLWERTNTDAMFLPMLQPHVVAPNDLLVGWGAGVARLRLQQADGTWNVTELWASNRLKPSFNDFVIHEGYIYGLDDGILSCSDLESGRRVWKAGRYGFGQLLLMPDADDLLVLTEKGELVRVAAQPDKHRELARAACIEGKTWNHPALVEGRLFARNSEEMACYQLKSLDEPKESPPEVAKAASTTF